MQANARMAGRPAAARIGGSRKGLCARKNVSRVSRGVSLQAQATKDGQKLDRKLRVAVVGGGPSGACTADELSKGGVETFMFERKLDNCKVCAVGHQRRW